MSTQVQAHSNHKKSLSIATKPCVSVVSRLKNGRVSPEGLTQQRTIRDGRRTRGSSFINRDGNLNQQVESLYEERQVYNSRLHSRNSTFSFNERKAA